ncbi:hypothetical protein CMUS01_11066 [Colletotrichum musicola]|uniref:Uncharacterized protein n=1 Tax=Colletotrichum musicola TaxID=2175873 RepID=A0A8H6K133_9PEZI|nr:hypothetical protein CMUS01_11066 [Colletotrichum musicola]
MPKYAELLKNRSPRDDQSSRTLTTTHRPTPQPTSTPRRQMQTFSSASPSASSLASMDFTVLPASYEPIPHNEFAGMRMPLLPDSFTVKHQSLYEQQPASAASAEEQMPQISVVAAHPENVTTASAMTEVEGFGVDGVELKWAHEAEPAAEEQHQPGLRDMWKGLVDEVVGRKPAL